MKHWPGVWRTSGCVCACGACVCKMHLCECIYFSLCVCMRMFVNVCLFAFVCAYLHVCEHKCMHVCVCVHACLCHSSHTAHTHEPVSSFVTGPDVRCIKTIISQRPGTEYVHTKGMSSMHYFPAYLAFLVGHNEPLNGGFASMTIP